MVRGKDSFWKHVKDLENGRFSCNYCKRDFRGGISRIKSHLSGVKGRDIQICPQVPEEVKLKAQQAIKAINTAPTKRAKSMAASNTVLQDENISGSSSSQMPNLCKGQDKSILDKHLARFLKSERISYHVINSPFFKDFVNGVAEHGPGYQVPRSNNAYEVALVRDIEKEVEEYVNNVKKYSVKTGCTLMYNQWPRDMSVVHIFAYTPKGVACMSATHAEIFKEMSSIIELIGPTNVVQVITKDVEGKWDGDTLSYISGQYPGIYVTSCATRGFELLLRSIYVHFVSKTIQNVRRISTYIYKNKVIVPYPIKKVNGLFIREQRMKDAIASDFFMLTSLLEVENELQALQEPIAMVSSNWGKPLTETQRKKFLKGASFIDYLIRNEDFWSQTKMVAQVMRSILQALCLVRCEGQTSGYLYEMMESVRDAVSIKDALKQCCNSYCDQCCGRYCAKCVSQFCDQCYDRYRALSDIGDCLDEIRSEIIHPIHAAAAFLNPLYMCSEKFKENDEIYNGVNHILEHLVAVDEKEDFVKQVELYRKKDSNVFTAEAMIMLKTYHPRIWWERCGKYISILQKYAIRILSQPCSSSLCNQYESMHQDVSQHAFTLNTMMMERYKSLKTQIKEPIILDKLEVSDDVNYQHLFESELDDEWDDKDYEDSFSESDISEGDE